MGVTPFLAATVPLFYEDIPIVSDSRDLRPLASWNLTFLVSTGVNGFVASRWSTVLLGMVVKNSGTRRVLLRTRMRPGGMKRMGLPLKILGPASQDFGDNAGEAQVEA
jgi:hypothetical protein